MSSIIITINIAAIVHMRTHKIPFNNDDLLALFILFYIISGIVSCILWCVAIEDVEVSKGASYVGRIAHTMGFCIFFVLLYCISLTPWALRFGVPGLIWFVVVMVAPCCPYIWRGLCQTGQVLRDWWKYVNRPQPVVNVWNGYDIYYWEHWESCC